MQELGGRELHRGNGFARRREASDAWQGRPTWAEIDLDAIAHNVRELHRRAGNVELIAAVKANAYGHGAVPVARAALEAGATRLAVACVDEGVPLRRAGIAAPILILGYAAVSEAAAIVDHRLALRIQRGDDRFPGVERHLVLTGATTENHDPQLCHWLLIPCVV